jgi:two-component system response regulator HydG
MTAVLIVDPSGEARAAVRQLLEDRGMRVYEADGLDDAEGIRPLSTYDLIISALDLGGGLGTDLVGRAGAVPVIVTAATSSLRTAIDCIRNGAADFLPRPLDADDAGMAIDRALSESERRRAHRDTLPLADDAGFGMIGTSPPMRKLFEQIRKLAPTASTALVQGESGTGKELVARALHAHSRRSAAPMISLNCAAIPDTLIESELFGHERGAFTGASAARAGLIEAADGATLFLDEIGELPMEAQARLLRVLQEGEIRRVGSTQTRRVDVRLIAATHRDLRKLASEGRFREDLFYRLNVVTLVVPPLRDRGADVLELARRLLASAERRLGRGPLRFSQGALDAIAAYDWPGNVRELENAIERAVILSDSDTIAASGLAIDVTRRDRGEGGEAPGRTLAMDDHTSLEDYFVRFVTEHQESMTETELAQKLGISRKSLWERRQRLGIPRKKTRNKGPLSSRHASGS